MKTYLIAKIFFAIKLALTTVLLFLIAKLFFGKNNFDFLFVNSADIKLTKEDA
jgi:hypothetical protein